MTSHLGFDGVCAIGAAFSVAELSGMATLLFGAAFGTSLCMGAGGGVRICHRFGFWHRRQRCGLPIQPKQDVDENDNQNGKKSDSP